MDEKDWSFLTTIYNEENLTRAAEKLSISQPALTYRIRQLEKELNIKIFIKGKNNIKFTKEGLLLHQYAKNMLSELSQLKDHLYEINRPGIGILKISAGENFANVELPTILNSFSRLYPNIKFNILSDNSQNFQDSLSNAESHIAITRTDFEWYGPKLTLREDKMYLFHKTSISIDDLSTLPKIIFQISPSSKRLDESWWNEYFSSSPNIGMKVNKFETCLEMVKQGFGYCILPMNEEQSQKLQRDIFVTPLYHKDGTPHTIKLFAYYREETTDLAIVKTFISYLKEYFSI